MASSAHRMESQTSGLRTTLPREVADDGVVNIGLRGAVLAVRNNEPVVLTRPRSDGRTADELPSGPYLPLTHDSLDAGMRFWVHAQTGLVLSSTEQLAAFGDPQGEDDERRTVSVGYLSLVRADAHINPQAAHWRSWYEFLPWEDWRNGRPELIDMALLPRLQAWAAQRPRLDEKSAILRREERIGICFGLDGAAWDDEKVVDRYELLRDAGIVGEAARRFPAGADDGPVGRIMSPGHRRVVAMAIGRLRSRLKHRPVVFDLLPETFTLYELQKVVESILGPHLHKQNFRRLVESMGLVEPTGDIRARTGGRPAKLYRFRRDVLLERAAPGVRVKLGRP